MLSVEKHLARIADALEKNNALLRSVLVRMDGDEQGLQCPDCGSDELDDGASTMGHPRLTCGKCGRSWEVENG